MARFEKGKSGNPRGRPVGTSPTAEYRKLLDAHVPALVDKAVELALDGDTTALRICLERVFPALKATDVPIQIGGLSGVQGLTQQGQSVLGALGAGDLSTSDAVHIMQAIAQQTRIVEADELERRVAALEAGNHR